MIIYYSVNGEPMSLSLPDGFIDRCRPLDLAEITAGDFWRNRVPEPSCLVHLSDVEGRDLGVFEVRREMRPVFTASPVREA
ncbi:hypothetical protein ALQ04_04303 [Pseudomonas cichorii]|uniref:Uncharacterized protein n=2 Tax=Pseudomonas cichorii TaxID=36746 RepID=A0A3M4M515_PSECI|nr:hypothetical protein ALQ04_04303 [Pseudomonas cichorii]